MTTITPSSTAGLDRPALRSAGTRLELQLDPGRLPEGLRIGTRVAIALIRQTDPSLVRLQVRPLEGAAVGTTIDQLQPSSGIPARLLSPVTTGATSVVPGNSEPPLSGEIVALQPKLILRLVAPTAPTDGSTPGQQPPTTPAAWLQAQLRQHLPRSQPLAQILDGWRQPDPTPNIATSTSVSPSPLPSASTRLTTELVAEVLAALPNTSDMTDPERLRHAIRHSGLWLEAVLAQHGLDPLQYPAPGADLKAQLARLAERIRTLQQTGAQETVTQRIRPAPSPGQGASLATPIPDTAHQPAAPAPAATRQPADTTPEPPPARPATSSEDLDPGHATRPRAGPGQAIDEDRTVRELRLIDRQVSGMLEKIVTNQLATLDSAPDQPGWLLDLPFRTPAGVAELEADIRRERRPPDKGEAIWHMRLRLDLPRLGPLTIRLSLRGDHLSAGLHAASAASGELLNRNLPALHERLTAKSIAVDSLHAGCRPDAGPRPPSVSSTTLSERA